jgi:hypothetical protein
VAKPRAAGSPRRYGSAINAPLVAVANAAVRSGHGRVPRTFIALVAAAALVAGCGDDEPAGPTVAETAPTAPAETAPAPTESTPSVTTPAEPPTVRLDAPSDGDQYLEGSTDSRADFKCRGASSCEATVQRVDGGDPVPIEDGSKLPTDPGSYRVVVVASGPGGEARAEATYEVPDLPGDGGSRKDTKPPPNLPEAGP